MGRGDSSKIVVGAGAVLLGRARVQQPGAAAGRSAAGNAGEFGEAQLFELLDSYSREDPQNSAHPVSQLSKLFKRAWRVVIYDELTDLISPSPSGGKFWSACITADLAYPGVLYHGWSNFGQLGTAGQWKEVIEAHNLAKVCDELNKRCKDKQKGGSRSKYEFDRVPNPVTSFDPDAIFAHLAKKLT